MMLSPLLRHLLSEEQGRTEWAGSGDQAWAIRRQRRGGGGGGGGGERGFERFATAVIDMKEYDRRDVGVSVEDGKVIVHGSRREGDESNFEVHETRRSLELPADADPSQLRYAKARGVVNLEVPLETGSRHGRRQRPEERRVTVEMRRAGAGPIADAAGAEALGPWRRRENVGDSGVYALRVPAPGFSASNMEVIVVAGKAIVKAQIKDGDGMRSMRHSYFMPPSLDAGRVTAEFVAAPAGEGGELILSAPEVRAPTSAGGGEESVAATQQSPGRALAGAGSGASDVAADTADRLTPSVGEGASGERTKAESTAGAPTISLQPPDEGLPARPADAVSAPEAAPPEAEAAAFSSAAGKADGGAWPLTKSPFERGLEPPPYSVAAEERAGDVTASDEWQRPFPPGGGAVEAAAAKETRGEGSEAGQPPLRETVVHPYGNESGVASEWSAGTDEPPGGVGRAPQPSSTAEAATPQSGAPASDVGGAETWPPLIKSPFDLGFEPSPYVAAAADENQGGFKAGDELPRPYPSSEAPASGAPPSEGMGIEQQSQPPPPSTSSPVYDVITPGYDGKSSEEASAPPAGGDRALEEQPSEVAKVESSSAFSAAGGDASAEVTWPPKYSPEAQPSSALVEESDAAVDDSMNFSLRPPEGEAPATQEAVAQETNRAAISPPAVGESDRLAQPELVGEAEREKTQYIHLESEAERRPEGQDATAAGGAADVDEMHAPLQVTARTVQYVVVGGEERHDAAQPVMQGTIVEENVLLRPELATGAEVGETRAPAEEDRPVVGEERREAELATTHGVGLEHGVGRPESPKDATGVGGMTNAGMAHLTDEASTRPSLEDVTGGEEKHETALPETPGGLLEEEALRHPEREEVSGAEVPDAGRGADIAPIVHEPFEESVRPAEHIGGQEQREAAGSAAHGGDVEEAERRSAESGEMAGIGGAMDVGAVYAPAAYTVRSTGQRGYASSLAMPTLEKAAAASAERRGGLHSSGTGSGDVRIPHDAAGTKKIDADSASMQETRHAHELGGA